MAGRSVLLQAIEGSGATLLRDRDGGAGHAGDYQPF